MRLWGAGPARLSAPPARRPRPPIVVGAEGSRGIERAARLADGWLASPRMTLEQVVDGIALFKACRQDAGRSSRGTAILGREVFCTSTNERAAEVAGEYLRSKYAVYNRWSGGQPGQPAGPPARDGRFLVGTPDQCVAGLLPYIRAGIDQLVVRTRWPGMPERYAAESIDLLSAEVIPELRRVAGEPPDHHPE